MTAGPTIDYEALTQDALRGVVRAVLSRAAKSGLPGEHHFYISFHTQAPGVTLSKRLREKYPREMTIVLQHRFWDLTVTDERFDVKLTFDGIPERIIVPFGAIKVFFDPSVRYGVQFEEGDGDGDESSELGSPLNYDRAPEGNPDGADGVNSAEADAGRSSPTRRPRVVRRSRHDKDAPITPLPTIAGNSDVAIHKDRPSTRERIGRHEGANGGPPPASEAPPPPEPDRGAEIVRLDLFRKK